MYIDNIKQIVKKAEKQLAIATSEEKNNALLQVAKSIENMRSFIKSENEKDIESAKNNNISDAMIDRLTLTDKVIDEMINGIHTVINFTDPVGKSDKVWTTKNGLQITKITVPIGVIAIIYEGRPNVTVDAFALALKSSNAIILRGSSMAFYSNAALEKAIISGLENSSIDKNVIHLVKDNDRDIVNQILTANDFIDLAIPRGGKGLIDMVVKNATVPTLQTGTGNNHIYIDETADIDMALNIVENAKMQRVGTCNAAEKILVNESIAEEFLTKLYNQTKDTLKFHTDEASSQIIKDSTPLKEDELSSEYLDYILGVKIVKNINEAIDHIDKYGSGHSEAIITNNLNNAITFQKCVDASAVYVNASTRFTDGGQFGFGLEMGISTQKMHARGPVGLNELVTSKYLILGNGQIRK